jgi:hexosaminidase
MLKNFLSPISALLGSVVFLVAAFPQLAAGETNSVQPAEHAIAIIPQPVDIQVNAGRYQLDPSSTYCVMDKALLDMQLDQRLLDIVDPLGLGLSKCSHEGDHRASITLELNGEEEMLGSEGYRLSVTIQGIKIQAATPVGVFYGIQTLRQLLPEPIVSQSKVSYESWGVPCTEIRDAPRFPWRGQLLDVSRHFLQLDFVRKNLDYLASLKLNVFHWHLTDDQGWRVEIEEYPRLTSLGAWRVDRNDEPWWGRAEQQPGEAPKYGGFYTRKEIRDVIEYARLRGITIVPEFDMPGHSRSAIAAYPEISCDGVIRAVATGGIADENTFCPGKEVTFEFSETILGSVMDLFPSEYIHIGGDECNKRAWRSCLDCKQRMQDEGLANVEELQSYFITRLEKVINERGRKMIGWDEILEGGLAPNAVVMSWRGESGGIAAARAGHEVVMTPNNYCYLDLKQGSPETEPELGYSQLLLSTVHSYEPLPKALSPKEASLILGVQGNLWGESIQGEENANYMLFPRLFAIAEVAWSPASRDDWDGFVQRLEPHLARLEARGIGYAPSLYQVLIEVGEEAVSDGVAISLTTEHGQVPIRYTLDGSAPTRKSTLYSAPLTIESSTLVTAAAFRQGQQLGRVSARVVELHMAIGKAIESSTQWSKKYHGGGAISLVDGERGSVLHTDGRWVGFQATDLDVTIDLGESKELADVSLGCLEVQGSWIFYPTTVEVLLSEDGEQFQSVGQLKLEACIQAQGEHKRDFRITVDKQRARFVRVRATNLMECPKWHIGAGGGAWLFVDEIVVR